MPLTRSNHDVYFCNFILKTEDNMYEYCAYNIVLVVIIVNPCYFREDQTIHKEL
jgi:hypothetical protein